MVPYTEAEFPDSEFLFTTVLPIPTELADAWLGCGGGEGAREAGVKAFVQWDMTCGELFGPRLSNARMKSHSWTEKRRASSGDHAQSSENGPEDSGCAVLKTRSTSAYACLAL